MADLERDTASDNRVEALQAEIDRLHHQLALVQGQARAEAAAILAAAQHRVRNMLAVVRALLGRTAHVGVTATEYAAHLKGRIDTLVRLQSVLTRSARNEADLEELVREEFVAQGGLVGNDVSVEGPAVMLAGQTAELLGLALHELTANSVEFGALSSEAGKVEVRWSVAGSRLSIVWAETGVSMSRDVAIDGFGQELIEEGLPYQVGAETSFDLHPQGFVCTIAIPLDRVSV